MKRIAPVLMFAVTCIVLWNCTQVQAQQNARWEILNSNEIVMDCLNSELLAYEDNIEMAGTKVAAIVHYSVNEKGILHLEREVFFPQLHEYKKEGDSWFHDYRAYLKGSFNDNLLPRIYIQEEQFVPGRLEEIRINGMLHLLHESSPSGLKLTRVLLPSMDERLFLEQWTIVNVSSEEKDLRIGNVNFKFEDYGAKGRFVRKVVSNAPESVTLQVGDSLVFSLKIMAKLNNEPFPLDSDDQVLKKRSDFLEDMKSSLVLETPEPVLNTLFEFSKIRASESIFDSELGLIHSPGGGRYYVGIWANDQAEYASPFFPYLGYQKGIESALNCYKAFAGETNPEYKKIRYAFEVEGLVKPFLKDRGDAAMIAYGASHFALALGDKNKAEELWPLIEWCLEYCHKQLNDEGVVISETDEMEGRIETGSANLSTSSLYFGALKFSADLCLELGKGKALKKTYQIRAQQLENSIENYFGAKVEGLDTYKYYKGHQYLRHWICLPLVVGINKRKEGTVSALFDKLWSENGVHVEKNSENKKISQIFWDRGTLYALRGTLSAGETSQSIKKLTSFSEKRLLGNRVPYVVEAYPEGDMAHLSAESALYCRIFTEGLFGMKPIGFKRFELIPHLPENWNEMKLRNIKAFGEEFDVEVSRRGKKIRVKILKKDTVVFDNVMKQDDSITVSI